MATRNTHATETAACSAAWRMRMVPMALFALAVAGGMSESDAARVTPGAIRVVAVDPLPPQPIPPPPSPPGPPPQPLPPAPAPSPSPHPSPPTPVPAPHPEPIPPAQPQAPGVP